MPHTFKFMIPTAAILAALTLTACNRTPDAPPPPPPPPTETASSDEMENVKQMMGGSEGGSTQGLPAGHPPIDAADVTEAPMQPTSPHAPPGRLVYEKPDAWKAVPPASRMRQDQFALPAPAADAEDGELVVFYFGPRGGGGVEANVSRWRGQFTTADGSPIPDDQFSRKTIKVGDLEVVIVDMNGRYNATSMTMGGEAPPPVDDYRMLGAIVETASGPWFFKAYGPAPTIAANEDAFMEFVNTFKVVNDVGM